MTRIETDRLFKLQELADEVLRLHPPGSPRDGVVTIRATELAELVRSYRANLSDLPSELQSLGTFGAAFAGALAGTLAPARLRRFVEEPAKPTEPPAAPRITQKPKRRKPNSGGSKNG